MKEDNYVAEANQPVQRSNKMLQFNLSTSNGARNFARLVDELQSQGVNFTLQQDGDLVWIDLEQ